MDASDLPAHAQAVTMEQLQIFSAIVEAGSFSAAARALRKTQGGVSYHVASLEEQLGLPLFDRSRRLPALTPAGAALLVHARRVLANLNELRAASWALSSGLEPRVFLTLNILFPPQLLAEVCREFQGQHPSVDLSVYLGISRPDTPEALRRGRAEFGVISYLDRSEEFVLEPCVTVDLVPVVAPTHPLAGRTDRVGDDELGEHVHLLLSDDSRPDVEDVVGFPSTKRWRINEQSQRIALLRAGLCWGRVPRHLVTEDLERGTLVPLRAMRWHGRPTVVDLTSPECATAPSAPPGNGSGRGSPPARAEVYCRR